jgi:GAF domain-containing protein
MRRMSEAASLGDGLQQRLLALIARSGALLGSPRVEDVLGAVVTLSSDLVAADGYAVWRLDTVRRAWCIASHSGVSPEFAAAMISSFQGQPVAPIVPHDPIAADDVGELPLLKQRRDAYAREGIRSMLAIPLILHDEATASLVFYYRTPHTFTRDDIEIARALGNLAAAALRTADLLD